MGLSGFSVVVKHALRSALLPIVSYAGPAAAALRPAPSSVESIFAIPGVGRYFVDAAHEPRLHAGDGDGVASPFFVHRVQPDRRRAPMQVIDPRVRLSDAALPPQPRRPLLWGDAWIA
jgi:hypothetical protein